MNKPSLDDRLLAAIFGPEPTAAEKAAREAAQRAKDVERAQRIVARICELDDFTDLKWVPARYWSNPVAVAQRDGAWVEAILLSDTKFGHVPVQDLDHLEILR